METLPPVEMVVSDAGSCTILQKGDLILYGHPGVAGERVCAQALVTLAPAAESVAEAAAEGRAMEPLTLTCPMEGCGAVFVLQVVGEDVARKFATPVPRSRRASGERGTGAGRARPRRGRRRIWKLAALLLLVAVLAGAGVAGVAYYSPQRLPRTVSETLKAWGFPVGGRHVTLSKEEPQPEADLGAAPAAQGGTPRGPAAAERPDAGTPDGEEAPATRSVAAEKPGAKPPQGRMPSDAGAKEPAGEPPEGDQPPAAGSAGAGTDGARPAEPGMPETGKVTDAEGPPASAPAEGP